MKTNFKKSISLIITFMMLLSSMFCVTTYAQETPDDIIITKVLNVSEELNLKSDGSIASMSQINNVNHALKLLKFNIPGVSESYNYLSSAVVNFKTYSNDTNTARDMGTIALYNTHLANLSEEWYMTDSAVSLQTKGYTVAGIIGDTTKINVLGASGTNTTKNTEYSFDVKNNNGLKAAKNGKFSVALYANGKTFNCYDSHSSPYYDAPRLTLTYNWSDIWYEIDEYASITEDNLKDWAFPLDLNLTKFNKLSSSDKQAVLNEIWDKFYTDINTPADFKNVYDQAMAKFIYTDTTNILTPAVIGRFNNDSAGGIETLTAQYYGPVERSDSYLIVMNTTSITNKAFAISEAMLTVPMYTNNYSSRPTDLTYAISSYDVKTLDDLANLKVKSRGTTASEDTYYKYSLNNHRSYDFSAKSAYITADVTDFVISDLSTSDKQISMFDLSKVIPRTNDGMVNSLATENCSHRNGYSLTISYDKNAVVANIKNVSTVAELEGYLKEWADVLGLSSDVNYSAIAIAAYKNNDITDLASFNTVVLSADEIAAENSLKAINNAQTAADVIDAFDTYGSFLGIDLTIFNALSNISKDTVAQAVVSQKGEGYTSSTALASVISTLISDVLVSDYAYATATAYKNTNITDTNSWGLGFSNYSSYTMWNASDVLMKFPVKNFVKAESKYIISAGLEYYNNFHQDGTYTYTSTVYSANDGWSEEKVSEIESNFAAIKENEKEIDVSKATIENAKGNANYKIENDITSYLKEKLSSNSDVLSLRIVPTAKKPDNGNGYRKIITRNPNLQNISPKINIKYDVMGIVDDLNVQTAATIEEFISKNGKAIGLNVSAYKSLEDKSEVNNALIGKNFESAADVKNAFDSVVSDDFATVKYNITVNGITPDSYNVSYIPRNTPAEFVINVPENFDKKYATADIYIRRANSGPNTLKNADIVFSDEAGYLGVIHSKEAVDGNFVDPDIRFDITDVITAGNEKKLYVQASDFVSAGQNNPTWKLNINYNVAAIVNDVKNTESGKALISKYQEALGLEEATEEEIAKVAAFLDDKTVSDAEEALILVEAALNGSIMVITEITDNSVTVKNLVNEDKTAFIIVGSFTDDNLMIDCEYATASDNNMTISAKGTKTFTYSNLDTSGALLIRAFVWDGIETLKPYSLSRAASIILE